MKIQRCKECGSKFSYTDVLDSVCWGYKPLYCKNCGKEYKLKMWYIFMLVILLSLPLLLINQIHNLALLLSLKMLLAVLSYIIYMVIIVAFYPFIIRYKTKENRNSRC